MTTTKPVMGALLGGVLLLGASGAGAQDWPQWRGPNRDARAIGFKAPAAWPKELTQKWKVTVGQGVATPALVGDRLYVFTNQGGNEITRCLDAATGNEIWQDKSEARPVSGIAAGRGGEFAGPRSSPTVADGKVITLGARGVLSCLDAATGKKVWRKDDIRGLPKFYTSSSPVVVDGLCIAQLGGEGSGAIVAYDLATGNEKWKWSGDGTAYASPVLLTLGGTRMLVAETATKIVGLGLSDGKLLWQTPFSVTGRGYNAATPMVAEQIVIYSGSARGTKAVKIEKDGDGLTAKQLWSNPDQSVQFSTPVLRDGLVFGLSGRDSLFCLNAQSGKTAWSTDLGGRQGRQGRQGYGSIVDAGPVLFALTPSSPLIVFEPNDKEFKQLASYKVSSTETYAYPVIAGNRVFVKDRDSIILWTIE
jgi:outer membrane protein assembly factor BamB